MQEYTAQRGKSTIKSFPLVLFRLTRFIKRAETIYGVHVHKKHEIGTKENVLHELHITYNIWLSLILYYYYYIFFFFFFWMIQWLDSALTKFS